jgi:hypothetical protein
MYRPALSALLLIAAGCSSPSGAKLGPEPVAATPAAIAAVVAPPVAPSPALPVAPPPPPPQHFEDETSAAVFKGDKLDECVRFRVLYDAPADAPSWPATVTAADVITMPHGIVRTKRPCEKQFVGMTALATCEVETNAAAWVKPAESKKPKKSKAEPAASETPHVDLQLVRIKMTASYYLYANVFEDHSYMRQCLERGGDWQAVAEDSPEYMHARLESHAGQALRLAKRYGAM